MVHSSLILFEKWHEKEVSILVLQLASSPEGRVLKEHETLRLSVLQVYKEMGTWIRVIDQLLDAQYCNMGD